MGKKEIIEEIEKMSVLDLADLVKELSDKFGVSAMPTIAVAGGGAAGGSAEGGAKAAEEKTEFSVVLKGCGDKKIQVIKVIRELTNLGLKEAKEIADTPPKSVKDGLNKEQAQEFKKKLEEAGAEVEVK